MTTIIIALLMVIFIFSFASCVDIIREYLRRKRLRRKLENKLNQVAKNNLKKLQENGDTQIK